jgi:uncharacterized membrane protein
MGYQMPVAQSKTFIAAPPERVWALISDLEKGPEWSLVTLECKLTSEGPPGLGCTYRSVSKFVASKVTTEHEIVEWVPARKIVSRVTKGGEATLTQLCEPEGEGTMLTMINKFTAPGALPDFVSEKLAQQVTNTLSAELARIKEVFEQGNDDSEQSPPEGASGG